MALARSPIAWMAQLKPASVARTISRVSSSSATSRTPKSAGAAGTGIRVVAVRGARVQRTIDDDLARSDGEQPVGSIDDVSGVEVLRDGVVESLRPDAAGDTKRSITVRDPAPPGAERPGPLHVNDADDAACRGRMRRGTAPHIGDAVIDASELADDVHRRVLAEQSDRMVGMPEPPQCGGIEPRAVQVGTDEHHREPRRDGVEQLAMRSVRPQRIAKPVADQRRVEVRIATRDLRGDQPRGRTLDAGEVETRADLRPLIEVDVVIPESRQHVPAVQVDDLIDTCRIPNIADDKPAIVDQHVLSRSLRCEACSAKHNAGQDERPDCCVRDCACGCRCLAHR